MKITRKFIREACLPVEIHSYLINIASTLENIFQDEIVLSKIQEATLINKVKDHPRVKDLFIEEGLIEEEDKNPFKKDLSYEDINNLNNTLYRVLGGEFIYVTSNACSNIITAK